MATDRPTLVVAFVAALVTLSVCGAAQASTVKQYRTAPGNMHDTDVDGDHLHAHGVASPSQRCSIQRMRAAWSRGMRARPNVREARGWATVLRVAYRPATFELGRQLRLRHAVVPDHALDVLRDRINALDNLPMDSRTPDALMRTRDEYLTWVEETEIKLAYLTHGSTVIEQLHTARYWEIRRLVPSDARPVPLIDGERRAQRDALQGMLENLEMHVNRARSAPGHITVLDTNSLLHYQLPDSIKWPEIVGQEQVRLVIPLRVIEELDAKKWGDGSEKLRDRARALLPKIDALIGLMGAPAPLADGVTIEVPVEHISGQPRFKPEDADEEILFTCRELWQLSAQPGGVTLITSDIAMRIRAEALGGIRPVRLPDKYLRQSG
jgi:hypothetical protein